MQNASSTYDLSSPSRMRVLRDVSVRHGHIPVLLLQLPEHCPAHNAHERRIAVRRRTLRQIPLCPLFLTQRVVFPVTFFAQGNEIRGAVASSLPAFQMVHIQRHVCLPAVETPVTIPEQYVFTHVPESHLIALLIFCAQYIWVLQFLRIKCSALNHDLCDRQYRMHKGNAVQMTIHFMLYRWSEPSVRSSAIIEPRSAIPRFSSSAAASCFPTRRQLLCDIRAKFHIRG